MTADLTAEVRALSSRTIHRLLDLPGRWLADPDHPDVFGWQLDDQQGLRVALVYYRTDADFEVDEDVLASVITDPTTKEQP